MDAMAAGTGAEAAAEEPPVGRAAARGALLGFLLVGLGVTWMAYSGGADVGGAVGVGVFVGIWGGCGFGGMMGATLCVARAEEREAAHDACLPTLRTAALPSSLSPTVADVHADTDGPPAESLTPMAS
jgi:hypothetical protein